MKNPTLRLILSLSLVTLTLFACNIASPSPTPDPGLEQTAIVETLAAITTQAAISASPIPSDMPTLATATSAPTAAPTNTSAAASSDGGAVRIKFAFDATTSIQEGQIQAGQSQRFLLGASADQPLIVSVGSRDNDVTFSVTGARDGKVLLSAAEKLSSWQTMLTVTQDYIIEVYGGASTENFTLNVITPARIRFAQGAVSGTYSGTTPGGYTVSYILHARKGQKMKLNLDAPNGNAVLSMYGYEDGQPYLRYVVEQTSFDFTLPATQDYIIQIVPRGGEVAGYTLTVEVK